MIYNISSYQVTIKNSDKLPSSGQKAQNIDACGRGCDRLFGQRDQGEEAMFSIDKKPKDNSKSNT